MTSTMDRPEKVDEGKEGSNSEPSIHPNRQAGSGVREALEISDAYSEMMGYTQAGNPEVGYPLISRP